MSKLARIAEKELLLARDWKQGMNFDENNNKHEIL